MKFALIIIILVLLIIVWLAILIAQNKDSHRLENWACTVKKLSPTIYKPSTLQELQTLISTIPSCSIIGTLHACGTTLFQTSPYINTTSLNKILHIEVTHVHVECGIIIRSLLAELAEHGLTLCCIPTNVDITLGGAISTFAHGQDIETSIVDTIIEGTLVVADGTTHIISNYVTNYSAIGTLGVWYSCKLLCKPISIVEHSRQVTQLVAILPHSTKRQYYYWSPYSNTCLLYSWTNIATIEADSPLLEVSPETYRISSDTRTPESYSDRAYVMKERLLKHSVVSSLYAGLTSSFPHMRKKLIPKIYNMLSIPSIRGFDYKLYPSIQNTKEELPTVEIEVALPIALYNTVLQDLMEVATTYISVLYIGYIISFGSGTNGYLSPTSGWNKVVYVSCIATTLDKHWKQLFNAIHDRLVLLRGGRPNLSKIHYLTPTTICRIYPNYSNYLTLKQKLDPNNKFGTIL